VLRDYDPKLTSRENRHPFVECSTFADDIKYAGGMWQSDFHFVDLPFIEEGILSDYQIKRGSRNITQGIHDIVHWLADDPYSNYTSSYIYNYLTNRLYPGRPDLAASYALRLLIHFVGDIMQPLHCVSRYSSDYPTGDAGGNAFELPYHYSVD